MTKWVITCEHGGNHIPQAYQHLFSSEEAQALLQTHRGIDLGALDLFRALANRAADFSIFSTDSRLLIELNRSIGHPSLYSRFTKGLNFSEKQRLLQQYYFPYRNAVEEAIQTFIANGHEVVHISVHSFTPELNGEVRNADIGLLYDPSNPLEKAFCQHWKQQLKQDAPSLKVRMNYPYLGTSDGLTRWLRRQFPQNYAGIELEVNQKFHANGEMQSSVKQAVVKSLLQ